MFSLNGTLTQTMTIEQEDFRLTNDGQSAHWDLEVLKTIRPKSGPERQEFQIIGYGYPLESALAVIINYRLSKKKDVYTLKEYLQDYKIVKDSLTNLLKN